MGLMSLSIMGVAITGVGVYATLEMMNIRNGGLEGDLVRAFGCDPSEVHFRIARDNLSQAMERVAKMDPEERPTSALGTELLKQGKTTIYGNDIGKNRYGFLVELKGPDDTLFGDNSFHKEDFDNVCAVFVTGKPMGFIDRRSGKTDLPNPNSNDLRPILEKLGAWPVNDGDEFREKLRAKLVSFESRATALSDVADGAEDAFLKALRRAIANEPVGRIIAEGPKRMRSSSVWFG